MKISNLLALGLMLTSLASCTKSDLQENSISNAKTLQSTLNTSSVQLSDLKPVSNWVTTNQQNSKQFSGTIQESSITSDVVNNGLVLVFANNGATSQSLPYTSENRSWFYHISKGSIQIIAYGNTGISINQNQNFQYVVLSSDVLNKLQANEKSKIDLMNMSHDALVSLLSKLK